MSICCDSPNQGELFILFYFVIRKNYSPLGRAYYLGELQGFAEELQ